MGHPTLFGNDRGRERHSCCRGAKKKGSPCGLPFVIPGTLRFDQPRRLVRDVVSGGGLGRDVVYRTRRLRSLDEAVTQNDLRRGLLSA